MTINDLDSSSSHENSPAGIRLPTWLKVGAVAAASALVGGLAATLIYRGTLQKLQDLESDDQNSNFGREEPFDDEGI